MLPVLYEAMLKKIAIAYSTEVYLRGQSAGTRSKFSSPGDVSGKA